MVAVPNPGAADDPGRGVDVTQAQDAEFTEFVVGSLRRLLHAGDLLTGDRGRAEDLVQHGLAKAYERWPSIRNGTPEAYVRRTMLNHYLNWWRRSRPREQRLLLDEGAPAAGDHAAEVARRDAVQRGLALLTRRERAVVVLRYWFQLSEAEIAVELGVRPGTVKSTCARALARLRTSPDLVDRPELIGGNPR
jgi:RNA polymerase sigma-70 factor (sigma-E family)